MQQTVRLGIDGMTCARCAIHVTQALKRVDGVASARVGNWRDGSAAVLVTNGLDATRLIEAVQGAGYEGRVDRTGGPGTAENDSDPPAFGLDVYDLLIVGGGSAAFAAAIRMSELGGRAAIINSGLPIGGTCVNVGCVPSKTVIRAAESAHRAGHTPFDGIQVSGQVSDFGAVTRQAQALVANLRQAKYVDIVSDDPNIELVEGRGRITSPQSVEVGDRTLRGRNILIATGARTFVPDIPGLKESGYLTNEELYRLDEKPGHLIVLGGRYIALENAQAFARLGVRVTVLQRSPRILPTAAADLTDALTEYLCEDGVDVRTSVTTEAVHRDGEEIVVETAIDGVRHEFRGSHIFVATGRQGNTDDLGLKSLGIETDARGFLQVDESLRTVVPGIFGAGDVIGEPMFVYTAAYEGSLAAQNAMQNFHLPRDYTALPWVVFTDPQVAGVGLDERQAAEAGIEFEVSRLDLDQVPRSIAARDTRGFIKLLRDASTDLLIGARILAPEGSELLMEVSMAMKYGITVRQITETFHPYLTLSEGIKLAAIGFGKDVKKLSCCAA